MDGRGHFSATVKEGEVPAWPGGSLFGELTDAKNAEIHLIVRSHDYAVWDDPEALGQQLSMFAGYCNNVGGFEEGMPGWNAAGNHCEDKQFAIHVP